MKTICKICGGEFIATRKKRKTCGKMCGNKWRGQNRKPIIDNKMQCARCKQIKPLTDFYYRNETPRAWCKQCDNITTVERQILRKQEFVRLKGGKCQKCGYDKCKGALAFHHTDPSKKEFRISKMHSLEKMLPELDKCILLCANCHHEEHTAPENW